MAGILVYCEAKNGIIDDSYAELVTAAAQISQISQKKTMALLVTEDVSRYFENMKLTGVDEIYGVEMTKIHSYATDSISDAVCQAVKKLEPDCILVPASSVARAVFSRVAVKLGIGMTADCTKLESHMEGKRLVIRQDKPSYGSQIMVSCMELTDPQLITITGGSYEPAVREDGGISPCGTEIQAIKVTEMKDIGLSESAICLIEETERENTHRMTDADIVVCVGRGCLEGDNLELAKKFAEKIGAVVGGTRPLADNGYIPFENQIGQTGCVICPRVCIALGISGAVQFTEGIKGNPLFIAVNNDPNAAIFRVADYAVVGDMEEVLTALLAKKEA